MSQKRSIQAIDKRIVRWSALCEQFPKNENYRTQLARLKSQRVRAANRTGKPQTTNDRH